MMGRPTPRIARPLAAALAAAAQTAAVHAVVAQPAVTRSAPASSPAPILGAAAELLLPAAVAKRLGVSEKLLERWRRTGDGPAYVRITRKVLRYQADAVDAFIASRVRNCTAGR